MMLARIIDWSMQNRLLVIIAAILAAWMGWRAMMNTPLDAIPDLSDVQVIVKPVPGSGTATGRRTSNLAAGQYYAGRAGFNSGAWLFLLW